MIIKMVNEFKLTVVHVALPNPMQICACAWSSRWTKNCGKSGLGRRVVVGRGPAGSKTRTLRPIVPFQVYRNVNLSLSFNILIYRDGRVVDTVCQHSRDLWSDIWDVSYIELRNWDYWLLSGHNHYKLDEMKMWSSQLWLRFKQSQSKARKMFSGLQRDSKPWPLR